MRICRLALPRILLTKLLVTVLITITIVGTTRPTQAQPRNNDCNDARVVGDGFHAFTNIDATTDGPNAICTLITSDVWFFYTAPCRGDVTVSTCGQVNYDSVITVYPADAGCPPSTTSAIACNDDGPCPEFSSRLTYPALENRNYLIQISSWHSEQGSGTLTLECTPHSGPLIVRGDANRDGNFSLPDVLDTIDYLSLNGSTACLAAIDANADESLDLRDIFFTLAAIFQGGPLPPSPYPDCGFSTTVLSCDEYAMCP